MEVQWNKNNTYVTLLYRIEAWVDDNIEQIKNEFRTQFKQKKACFWMSNSPDKGITLLKHYRL